MKKFLTFFAAAALCCTLLACNSSNDDDDDEPSGGKKSQLSKRVNADNDDDDEASGSKKVKVAKREKADNGDDITGEWSVAKMCVGSDCVTNIGGTFYFNSDGSCTISMPSSGYYCDATWYADGDNLYTETTEGVKERLRILELDSYNLTLEGNQQGYSYTVELRRK